MDDITALRILKYNVRRGYAAHLRTRTIFEMVYCDSADEKIELIEYLKNLGIKTRNSDGIFPHSIYIKKLDYNKAIGLIEERKSRSDVRSSKKSKIYTWLRWVTSLRHFFGCP